MATGPGCNQGKTAFLKEFLPANRDASQELINEAWWAAGHEGSISDSVFYKIKRELAEDGGRSTGKSGPTRASSPETLKVVPAAGEMADTTRRPEGLGDATGTRAGVGAAPTWNRERLVDEVEVRIDELMFTLKLNGGMPEVKEAQRVARRLLTRSAGGA